MKAINALRVATEGVHRELEAAPRLSLMLSPNLKAFDYAQLLLWWHNLWATLESFESMLRPANADEWIIPQPRAYKARADLEHLMTILGLKIQPLVLSLPQRPELQLNTGSWLGLIYVMRGSELGNKVVLKHLKTCFSGTPVMNSLSFFESTASATPWPSFVSKLDALIAESEQTSSASLAAVTIFEWLCDQATLTNESSGILLNGNDLNA